MTSDLCSEFPRFYAHQQQLLSFTVVLTHGDYVLAL